MKNVEAVRAWGVCEHDICARWIVANSGISPEYWGIYKRDNIIGAGQQFFRTFQGKRQQRGNFIKCAEVRTKKELCNTIMRRSENLDFPGKTELVDTITRAREIIKNLQKLTLKKDAKSRTKKKFNDTV